MKRYNIELHRTTTAQLFFLFFFLYRIDSSQHFHSLLLLFSTTKYKVVVQQDHTHHTLSALPITEFCYDILFIVSLIIRVPIISSIKF